MKSVHYTLKTTSTTATLINLEVTYDVYYDEEKGIAYEVKLKAPPEIPSVTPELETVWHAKIFNGIGQKRLEYDIRKRIFYRTKQTMEVESALYKLQEDVQKFLDSDGLLPVSAVQIGDKLAEGYKLFTLTIWYDSETYLPLKRVNEERGNQIVDEFIYHSIDEPLPDEVFDLQKPPDAIADFNLYPEAPSLPRFEEIVDADSPQYGVYVKTLLEQVKRHIITNQWEYGPFATIIVPWLTKIPVMFYRAIRSDIVPPIIVAFDVPYEGRIYFYVTYDFLGYVVTGFTETEIDLNSYEELPLQEEVMLKDFIPLYQSPSLEKNFIINNYRFSVQSNDFFINAFDMGGKEFDTVIKNFSFNENEGYLIMNVYGKEYWNNANIESMFNFVVTGQFIDAHTTPLLVYNINTIKRMGIYQRIKIPEYEEIPGS
ncbi:MAG: hypothetical protein KAX49_10010 [Halanaerobiales bacterium]|nr:hypothetical protein [Halanaerobiales bacterium]